MSQRFDVPRTDERVAVILVNWNGWRDTVECLDSLLASHIRQHRIFVVDNASTDGSVERIAAWCRAPQPLEGAEPREGVASATELGLCPSVAIVDNPGNHGPVTSDAQVVLVRSGANLGFAGGNNVGIRAAGLAGFSHFWILNTDTVVHVDALDALLERARADRSIGMVGSSLTLYWQPGELQAMGGATFEPRTTISMPIGWRAPIAQVPIDPTEVEARMAYVVGASILVSREFVRTVGLMCDDYFLYFEELDWAVRAKGRFRLGYAPRSVVYHKVGGSTTQVAALGSLRYLYRNRLKFVARYMPGCFVSVLGQLTFEMVRHVVKGRFGEAGLAAGALLRAGALWREGRAGWHGAFAGI